MLISSTRFLQMATNAEDDAIEYRVEAVTASEDRKKLLLKWADQREEDARFYRNQSWYAQQREARTQRKAA